MKNENQNYIDKSYEFVNLYSKYYKYLNDRKEIEDKKISHKELLEENEMNYLLNFFLTCAHNEAIKDGYISPSEQEELIQIKNIYLFYNKKTTSKKIFKDYCFNQIKDVNFLNNDNEFKKTKPSFNLN